jgi:1,4-dihydroxy-2-naphthoyl-CoA hydrolase
MPFVYERTARFADSDAAGIVFFANYLVFCHEAYEESLAAAGIGLQEFFQSTGVMVPIARSEVDYLRPISPGEKIRVTLHAELLAEHSFALHCEIFKVGPPEKIAARVRTEHVTTSMAKRERVPLPAQLAAWVKAT